MKLFVGALDPEHSLSMMSEAGLSMDDTDASGGAGNGLDFGHFCTFANSIVARTGIKIRTPVAVNGAGTGFETRAWEAASRGYDPDRAICAICYARVEPISMEQAWECSGCRFYVHGRCAGVSSASQLRKHAERKCDSCDELMLPELIYNHWHEADPGDLPPDARANDSRGSWDQRSEVLVAVMIMCTRLHPDSQAILICPRSEDMDYEDYEEMYEEPEHGSALNLNTPPRV